jgi:hypothetical protein
VDLPVWGIGVIALYSLLQIPAVLLVARYCEVDAEDLPTPPMRARWRDGDPQNSRDSSATGSSQPDQPSAGPDDSGPSPNQRIAPRAPDSSTERSGAGNVRCPNCGATNDPAFVRCQRCVSEL